MKKNKNIFLKKKSFPFKYLIRSYRLYNMPYTYLMQCSVSENKNAVSRHIYDYMYNCVHVGARFLLMSVEIIPMLLSAQTLVPCINTASDPVYTVYTRRIRNRIKMCTPCKQVKLCKFRYRL